MDGPDPLVGAHIVFGYAVAVAVAVGGTGVAFKVGLQTSIYSGIDVRGPEPEMKVAVGRVHEQRVDGDVANARPPSLDIGVVTVSVAPSTRISRFSALSQMIELVTVTTEP